MPTEPTVVADPERIDAARQLVAAASRIVVLTGAGISTDSGIRDFRGPNGLWTKNPEAEKMATLDVYVSEPDIRKKAWQNRLHSEVWQAAPNDGHRALVALERRGTLDTLITQNIDGLHQAAGSDPALVVEVHGTVHEVACLSCDDRAPMERALERVRAGEEDPPCRSCGGILKSATISFGQNLVEADIRRAFTAAQQCDLFLAIGSSLGVYPAAETVPIALEAGADLVILNGEPTPYDRYAAVVLRGSISDVLPVIVSGIVSGG
jgi:NAD-dependent deacetylase